LVDVLDKISTLMHFWKLKLSSETLYREKFLNLETLKESEEIFYGLNNFQDSKMSLRLKGKKTWENIFRVKAIH
jgi:hypothetical protein